MIHFLTRRPSEEFAWDYANRISEDGGLKADVICYEDLLDSETTPAGVYVFTGLNRFGVHLKGAMADLYQTIDGDPSGRALNDPSRCMGRYELLRALYQQGKNEFKVRGAWEDLTDLKFPAFVRDRSKDGGMPRLLHSRRDIEKEVGWALVRGADISELIVVEFLDTAGDDGLYRKYSAYIVGNRVLPVSLEMGQEWVLRYPEAKFTPDGLKEEELFVLGNPHAGQLAEIRAVAGIGFGRMDYSLLRGRVQVWEINTLPTMRLPTGATPMPSDLKALRKTKMEFFKQKFREAWGVLDESVESSSSIRIQLPEDLVASAQEELAGHVPSPFPHPEKYSALKTLFRPVKSVAIPLATQTVIPLFARSVMRQAGRETISPAVAADRRESQAEETTS